MAKLVRHLTHNQAMRGFDSRSRNEGWQCARTGKTVKHCTLDLVSSNGRTRDC